MNVDELKSIIAATLNVPVNQVTDDSYGLTIPEWDSVGHMNVVLALEERFETPFTAEGIMAMRDIAAIRTVLQGKLS